MRPRPVCPPKTHAAPGVFRLCLKRQFACYLEVADSLDGPVAAGTGDNARPFMAFTGEFLQGSVSNSWSSWVECIY